nr:unnamed protein product [Callosobruchus chinensis]
MKNKFTCGPDGIPSFLIRDCAPVFSLPLTKIYNLCIKTNSFPVVWRESNVRAIFKKGDRLLAEHYRPITLVCNVSKSFETLLHNFFISQYTF